MIDPTTPRSAVFIDYDDLTNQLRQQVNGHGRPDEIIRNVLDGLSDLVSEQNFGPIAIARAYTTTDAARASNISNVLSGRGIAITHLAERDGSTCAALRLCVDAAELLFTRQDITSFILITGNQTYLPLLEQVVRYGRRVHLITIEASEPLRLLVGTTPTPVTSPLDFVTEGRYARSTGGRATRTREARPTIATPAVTPTAVGAVEEAEPTRVTYRAIESGQAYRTMEIIEEHFGQYDEVYLTPLLRKLSDSFSGSEYDPKGLISELEEAGAVWLEKRKGFPYDYTVLLIDSDHPDVRQIQEAILERERLRETYSDDRNMEEIPPSGGDGERASAYTDRQWEE